MYVTKRVNKSGTVSVWVVEKRRGGNVERKVTIGSSSDEAEIVRLVEMGRQWILDAEGREQPELDLFREEKVRKEAELARFHSMMAQVCDVRVNGADIILGRAFDAIGFGDEDPLLRKLVVSRICNPASKAATVEYSRNFLGEDVSLQGVYRCMDRLDGAERARLQAISVEHTRRVLGGTVSVMFYDVTTLYFDGRHEDDLRRRGFSKDGKHHKPQVVLGLLVGMGGYPLAYRMHPGNQGEGGTMLPIVEGFIEEYHVKDFVVVADSGLMSKGNVAALEERGYKYVIGARIRSEKRKVRERILAEPKVDGGVFPIDMGDGRRLLVGYSASRAGNDARNRERALRKLEREFEKGNLTKDHLNNRGYNSLLSLEGNATVRIDPGKVEAAAAWDGLKGYLTNTDLPDRDVLAAYHGLWAVERAFRLEKARLEIRPMYHFTRSRMEAHVCICFLALKVYKELERRMKAAGMRMGVDKAIDMARSVATIQAYMPLNRRMETALLLMDRHKPIGKLFTEEFWAGDT